MSKVVKTQLVWKYEPKDFFEQPILEDEQGYSLKIEDGEVVALINAQVFKNDKTLKQDLTRQIKIRFLSVQLSRFRGFKLGECLITDLIEGGDDVVYTRYQASVQTHAVRLDYNLLDENGNLTAKQKAVSPNDEKRINSLLGKHFGNDQVLDHCLHFLDDAAKDNANSLAHLYNIRDSLIDELGSMKEFLKVLDIDKGDNNRFGKLTNNLPLNQGRHKGLSVGELRDATGSELNEAKRIAVKFIRSYLDYLDNSA